MSTGRVLTSVHELAEMLARGEAVTVLDVRWSLAVPDGRPAHLEGHLPGAVFVDLERELADPPSPERGRHPLPDVARLEDAARRWGVSRGVPVVVHDDAGGLAAARAWWLLRWAGLDDVSLLDGGLRAWRAAGHDLESGEVSPARGDVALTPGHLPVLTADEAASCTRDGALLDARAAERYRGEVEPIDPRAGHVPGAVSAPTSDNLDESGRFRSVAELRRRFEGLGVSSDSVVGVYCGSGVTAAHQIAALALAGVDAALYPGSWSQWSSDPGRPVETA